jgi:hypothetical protein
MTIATLDTEIARLQADARTIEHAPRTFDEVWPVAEAALVDAEAALRRFGPALDSAVPRLPEAVHHRHQVVIGAAMVANRKALMDSERARVKADTDAGISATDKQRRGAELRAAILKLCARRELLLRSEEADGAELRPRQPHAELFVFRQADVERLAR